MGQINIASTPRDSMQGASVFDPTTQRQPNRKLDLLRPSSSTSQTVGGRFTLPPEFDQRRYAAAFQVEGNETEAMMEEQPVLGTGWVAEGWKPWKYPQTVSRQKRDEQGELVFSIKKGEKKDDPDIKTPVFAPHPNAGKLHKIKSLDREGPTYILMCRPIEVQNQVNEAYGLVSIDNMVAEARGETIAGEDPNNDRGMLGAPRLGVERDIEADHEMEQTLGRSTVVQPSIPHNTGRLSRPPQQISQ